MIGREAYHRPELLGELHADALPPAEGVDLVDGDEAMALDASLPDDAEMRRRGPTELQKQARTVLRHSHTPHCGRQLR